MNLSVRLQMNADMVPVGSRAADIGCDHGYVSIYLAEKKICDKILALDVREGPLSAARKNIAAAGLSDRIECRLSDGMKELDPGETDTLLIAGMGGKLVCRILVESPDILSQTDTLVIQPQSDMADVRRLLPTLGFQIEEERCCHENGKWYLAMRAVRSDEERAFNEAEYRYGWILQAKEDAIYHSYLLGEKEKAQRIMAKLEVQSTAGSATGRKHWHHVLVLLEEALSLYKRTDRYME